jgi:cytosine/adenosine deaminase-related metal-dependent hydrolase
MTLDILIFSTGRDLIRTVMAGGKPVVRESRHHARDAIAQEYRATVSRLAKG